MLHYTEFGISHVEVPGENSICIYISGCQLKCKNCHYPDLQKPNYGGMLSKYYEDIISLYYEQATCVCFLGEGPGDESARRELIKYSRFAKSKGLRTCLYSGRDIQPEDWMRNFDYIKVGSYKEEYGPLDSTTTNQRMFRNTGAGLEDITEEFWDRDTNFFNSKKLSDCLRRAV